MHDDEICFFNLLKHTKYIQISKCEELFVIELNVTHL